MSTRIPPPYSPKILELPAIPNLGSLENVTIVESAGSPACGGMIKLYLKIKEGKEKDVVETRGRENGGKVLLKEISAKVIVYGSN